jgi:hypothetical protein
LRGLHAIALAQHRFAIPQRALSDYNRGFGKVLRRSAQRLAQSATRRPTNFENVLRE